MKSAKVLILLLNIKFTILDKNLIKKRIDYKDVAVKSSDFAGSLTDVASNAVTALPLSAARAIGSSGDANLKFFKNNIDVTVIDKFLKNYQSGTKNEDAQLTGTQLAIKYGYYVEDHYVTTEDGYILKVLRIRNDEKSDVDMSESKIKPPVLLMHGLLGSADDYIFQGPKLSLAYILADAGYDVWLGNARGNTYSRNHTHLDPNQADFWAFSWDDVGCKDLPSIIDHVLNTTNANKVRYVGFSQGTTAFFVMGSMRPEYNDKVAIMFALSAVAYMEHTKSPVVRLLSSFVDSISLMAKLIGFNEFLPHTKFVNTLASVQCDVSSMLQMFCTNILFLACGFNLEESNSTSMSVFFGHCPAGSSARSFAHYGQEVVSKDFRRYDFGSAGNLEKYQSEKPPSYEIQNITTPLFIFYSKNDWLADVKDVMRFAKQLPNCVGLKEIPKYNHLDYVFGISAKEKVYDVILKTLEDYSDM